jgi:hypothetical protein
MRPRSVETAPFAVLNPNKDWTLVCGMRAERDQTDVGRLVNNFGFGGGGNFS